MYSYTILHRLINYYLFSLSLKKMDFSIKQFDIGPGVLLVTNGLLIPKIFLFFLLKILDTAMLLIFILK